MKIIYIIHLSAKPNSMFSRAYYYYNHIFLVLNCSVSSGSSEAQVTILNPIKKSMSRDE